MKTLPLQRLWTGDGRGLASAVTHTQLKRTDTTALYSVTDKRGVIIGYEVFIVKKRLKGQPLPGGLFEEEDREVYPSANSFGRIAWAPANLSEAERRYNELCSPAVKLEAEDEEVETVAPVVTGEPRRRGRQPSNKPAVNLTIPVAEFTVGELAEQNGVQYPIAFMFLKGELEKNTVKLLRTEKRCVGKGKPSNIYAKC